MLLYMYMNIQVISKISVKNRVYNKKEELNIKKRTKILQVIKPNVKAMLPLTMCDICKDRKLDQQNNS